MMYFIMWPWTVYLFLLFGRSTSRFITNIHLLAPQDGGSRNTHEDITMFTNTKQWELPIGIIDVKEKRQSLYQYRVQRITSSSCCSWGSKYLFLTCLLHGMAMPMESISEVVWFDASTSASYLWHRFPYLYVRITWLLLRDLINLNTFVFLEGLEQCLAQGGNSLKAFPIPTSGSSLDVTEQPMM